MHRERCSVVLILEHEKDNKWDSYHPVSYIKKYIQTFFQGPQVKLQKETNHENRQDSTVWVYLHTMPAKIN